MPRLLTAVLAAALTATTASAWTPEVVQTANLGGDVTAMDLTSSVIPGKTSVTLPIDSVERCIRGCADFRNGKGCNTINFCAKEGGCGSGCSQRELGPFGGGNMKCTDDGKFPYGTCSLKWNDDIYNPIIYEEGTGDWLAATTANGFKRQGTK